MKPDDPRHGTYAGYVAHISAKYGDNEPCVPCKLANRAYMREYRRQGRDRDLRRRTKTAGNTCVRGPGWPR